MSEFAERVKRYYELGLWDDGRVRAALERGRITEGEYSAITGKVE